MLIIYFQLSESYRCPPIFPSYYFYDEIKIITNQVDVKFKKRILYRDSKDTTTVCHKCFILHLDIHSLKYPLFMPKHHAQLLFYKITYTVCTVIYDEFILEHNSRITFKSFLMSIMYNTVPA